MTNFQNALESWALSYLLNSLWQIPLLFAVGWIAARVLRKAGAAAEHRVWAGILILESLLPALSAIASGRLRQLWMLGRAENGIASAGITLQMGTVTGISPSHVPGGGLTALAIAFGAVTLFFAARFAWRCAHLRMLRRTAECLVLSPTAEAAKRRCEARLGVKGIEVARSARIFAPLTMGRRRPILLIPDGMAGRLSEEDLVSVMAHEFAHIRRNDFAKNLLYELVTVPVSYHPLLYLTRERLMETREMVCDGLASGFTEPIAYGRSLLRLASLLVNGTPARTPHAIGIFDANTLERRLMRLKEHRQEISTARRVALFGACGAFALTVSATALALGVSVNAPAMAATNSHSGAVTPHEVPSGDAARNVSHKVMPVYPPEAKAKHIQGTVKLNATIDKHGRIEDLKVESGPEELRQSALDAVKQWRYKPFLMHGKPTAVKTTINVIYSLGNSPAPAGAPGS